ncbi:MAG TPA: YciI family protein [Polyangia bacterium]|jgi:uncharacterized protein YciI|nr:YciI family protein [Polyangia bacterium]
MYAYVVLRYLVPMERLNETVDRHRAYLRGLKARRKLVASGPLVPRTGGALLLRADDDAELQQLIAGDPFAQERLVEHTVHVWAPNIGNEELDGI